MASLVVTEFWALLGSFVTTIFQEYIHIEQEKAISQSDGEMNSMTFSHCESVLFTHKDGTKNWLEHENGLVAFIIHLVLVFGFIYMISGVYQFQSWVILIS